MKTRFLTMAFVSLFAVVALCSCNKDEEGSSVILNDIIIATVENSNSYNGQIDSVKAIIVIDWGEYDAERDEFYSVGYEVTSSAPSNGGFTLKLPATVSDNYLKGFDYRSGITISDTNVKIGETEIVAYKSGKKTGEFYHEKKEWYGFLRYANGDVSITGTYTKTYDSWGYKDIYNVHLKKGWNMMYCRQIYIGDHNYEYDFTTTVPAGAKWYYSPYYSSSSQGSVSKKIPALFGKSKNSFFEKRLD